jgi:hypothetical protein
MTMLDWTTLQDRPVDSSRRTGTPKQHAVRRCPLLVAVRSRAELGTVAQVAGRAAAESRTLVVALIVPPARWTADAAVVPIAQQRRARELAALRAAVQTVCCSAGTPVTIRQLVAPRALTEPGRQRALRRRLTALAGRLGAELHPLPLGTARGGAQR